MPVSTPFPLIAVVAVAALGLTGCAQDPRGALTAVEQECAAAALVTETLIESGGARDSALVADLVALGEVASPSVRGATDTLISLAGAAEESAEFRTEWFAVLDDLDRAVLDRCDFSVRALVTDAGLRFDSAGEGDESVQETAADSAADSVADSGLEADRPLDWEDVQSRVEAASWSGNGYRGIVGVDPGIHVTIYGVESAQLAMTVCEDTREALAIEASDTTVAIEVHGLDEGLLAQTLGGDCVLR